MSPGNVWGRLLAALAAIAAFAILTLQPNIASDTQRNYLERTAQCLDLLMNDPLAHARDCGGGAPVTGVPESLIGPGPVAAPTIDPCINGGSGGGFNAAAVPDGCDSQASTVFDELSGLFAVLANVIWPADALDGGEAIAI